MVQINDKRYPKYKIYKYGIDESKRRIEELNNIKKDELTTEEDGELNGLTMSLRTKKLIRFPLLKVGYIVERGNYEREDSILN